MTRSLIITHVLTTAINSLSPVPDYKTLVNLEETPDTTTSQRNPPKPSPRSRISLPAARARSPTFADNKDLFFMRLKDRLEGYNDTLKKNQLKPTVKKRKEILAKADAEKNITKPAYVPRSAKTPGKEKLLKHFGDLDISNEDLTKESEKSKQPTKTSVKSLATQLEKQGISLSRQNSSSFSKYDIKPENESSAMTIKHTGAIPKRRMSIKNNDDALPVPAPRKRENINNSATLKNTLTEKTSPKVMPRKEMSEVRTPENTIMLVAPPRVPVKLKKDRSLFKDTSEDTPTTSRKVNANKLSGARRALFE